MGLILDGGGFRGEADRNEACILEGAQRAGVAGRGLDDELGRRDIPDGFLLLETICWATLASPLCHDMCA